MSNKYELPDYARHVHEHKGKTFWATEWSHVPARTGDCWYTWIVRDRWSDETEVKVYRDRVELECPYGTYPEAQTTVVLSTGHLAVLVDLLPEIAEMQKEILE